MGLLRFLLALLVVYSHTYELGTYSPFGSSVKFYSGAFAVIVFYMISGYYMIQKLGRHQQSFGRKKIRFFYFDRVWRIYPCYLMSLAISLAYLLLSGKVAPGELTASLLLSNATLLPLYFYNHMPQFLLHGAAIVAPSVSLALEEYFFLLLPLIASRARWFFLASLGVYLYCVSGRGDPYQLAYVGLPGTLFVFLLGSELQKGKLTPFALLALLSCLGAATWLLAHPSGRTNHLLELAVAVVVGIGILWTHAQLAARTPEAARESGWQFIGAIAYPLFLLHWITVDYFSSPEMKWLVIPSALILALPLALVDQEIQRRRRKALTSPALRQ